MRFLKIFGVWILVICCQQAFAQMDFPFKITMVRAQPQTMEGDPINFNVTVQNVDPARPFPILIPGEQAGYNKIFYFKIEDADANLHVLRAIESREVTMSQQTPSLPTLRYLKPGEKVIFSANINDFPRSFTRIESNHFFTTPLFAGRYNVYLIYDPTGNPIGDTLYNYCDPNAGSQCPIAGDKLCLPTDGQISAPYALDILKSDKQLFNFQNVMYACKLKNAAQNRWEYSRDNIPLRIVDVPLGSANASYDVEYDYTGKQELRAFRWSADHALKEYRERGLAPCNAERVIYKMRNAHDLEYSYQRNPDGSYTWTSYADGGWIEYTNVFHPGETVVEHIVYKVKNGTSTPGKVEKIPLSQPFDPCNFHPKS